jgi:hypothetical protein
MILKYSYHTEYHIAAISHFIISSFQPKVMGLCTPCDTPGIPGASFRHHYSISFTSALLASKQPKLHAINQHPSHSITRSPAAARPDWNRNPTVGTGNVPTPFSPRAYRKVKVA